MLVSRYALIIKGEGAASALGRKLTNTSGLTPEEAEQAEDADTDPDAFAMDIDDGIVFGAERGYTLEAVRQNQIPNDKLGEHLLTYLRMMLAPLRVDAASEILSDFSKLNFSSSRAARQTFGETIRILQNVMRHQFYDRVYRWRVGAFANNPNDKLFIGDLDIDDLLDAATWTLPTPQLNGKEAAEEAAFRIKTGQKSYSAALMEQNINPDEHRAQIISDITTAIEAAKEIEKRTGVSIDWRPLAGMESAKTEAAEIAKQKSKEEGDEDDADNAAA